MKKTKLFLLTVLLLFTYYKVYSDNSANWKEGKVIIQGKVINFEKHNQDSIIKFILINIIQNKEVEYPAIINKKGEFKLEVKTSYPQEFLLLYGSVETLFSSPEDSLYLEIDADILNDTSKKNPNGQFFIRKIGGTAGEINHMIHDCLAYLPRVVNEKDTVKSKTAEEYKTYINKQEKIYANYLEEFIKVNHTNELFKQWAGDRFKYDLLVKLMSYPSIHPELNGMEREKLRNPEYYIPLLPESYFSFLNNYNMDDSDLITLPHATFLNELYCYSREVPIDSLKKSRQFMYKNDLKFFMTHINMIKQNSSGFTQDILLAKIYSSLLQNGKIDLVDSLYDPGFTNNSIILNTVKREYKKQKDYFSNKDTKGVALETWNSDSNQTIIDSIARKYKNKVIYVDFWAPWCGPCMEEMPFSKEIQAKFQNKDVVFLFIANQCDDNLWRSTIANKGLTGEHILLSYDQFKILSSQLDFSGIPHYLLINKSGNVVLKNAPRPSDKEKITNEIEKLLTNQL